jgi:serine/threonine protein kinase
MEETITLMLSSSHGQPAEPVEIPRRVGHVKLGDVLGEGTGGVVLTGYDEALSRRVAVKLLHRRDLLPAQADRLALIEGIRSAAGIKHGNLLTVYHVETVNDLPVIVMEYIDGISLRDLSRRIGPMDIALALYVMRAIAAGVEALHAAGVVHRDLKPANVLFDRDGQAHVCDFGLACKFDLATYQAGCQTLGGSPLYMAPEMFEGHVSPQSDVYALGIMLFEVLGGQAQFFAGTLSDMQARHTAAHIPLHVLKRHSVPAELCEVVRRALHKQRFLRYKTGGRFLQALEAIEVPNWREETQRLRVAEIVTARQHRSADAAHEHLTPPAAQTTFDLVARRAAEKRRSRGD